MKKCTFCGVENKDHIKVCTNCGHKIIDLINKEKNKSSELGSSSTNSSDLTKTIKADKIHFYGMTNPQNPIWINIYRYFIITTTVLGFIGSIVGAYQLSITRNEFSNTTSLNNLIFIGMSLLGIILMVIYYVFNMIILNIIFNIQRISDNSQKMVDSEKNE